MFIAKQKRKENIAEYILYLWQLEDMFRALEFHPEKIYATLVEPQLLDEEKKQTAFFWYIDMMNLLISEGKKEHGHLEHTLHLIADLNDLHLRLLQLPVGKDYAQLFSKLSPELPALKAGMEKPDMSDMEACFRALYSVILLRLKGDETHDRYILDVIELISPVIGCLSEINRKIETGETDMFREES